MSDKKVERRGVILLRAARLRRDKSAYALARFRRDDCNWWLVAGNWPREDPLVKNLTYEKIGLNKNYECNRGNC
jgi:hypothetical protein